jgi:hypothetical protein
VQKAIGLAGIEQRQDVGLLHRCVETDLAQESLGVEYRGEFRAEELEGDWTIVLEISGRDRPWPCRSAPAGVRTGSGREVR